MCERERFPSLVWERERLPSKEVTLEPEAVRERTRRVMLAAGTERRGGGGGGFSKCTVLTEDYSSAYSSTFVRHFAD